MRTCLAVFSLVVASLVSFPIAYSVEPAAEVLESETLVAEVSDLTENSTVRAASPATEQQFVVKCSITDQSVGQQAKKVSSPKLMVTDGHEVTVQIQSMQPFVTGARSASDGEVQPVITTVKAGLEVCVTVKSLDGERVQLDATITSSDVTDVQEVAPAVPGGPTTQAAELSSNSCRIIRAVDLGDTIEIACGCQRSEDNSPVAATLTVERMSADEASITPIAAVESTQPAPLYVVVYNVVDLLESHAQVKALDELTDADLVPVVDLLISDALVAWPEEAEIKPFPQKGQLVISQTQEAHEKIGRFFRDQRDDIAAVKKLLK